MLYMYCVDGIMKVGDMIINNNTVYDLPWKWKINNKRVTTEQVYREYRAAYYYWNATKFFDMPDDMYEKNARLYVTQKDLDRHKEKYAQASR